MDRYPAPMRNLMPWVRDNAAEIADAFLREGMSEGGAIRIAIAQAKHWLRSGTVRARMRPAEERAS
ncbi:hypothetical protein [Burkholderia pseudomallei]|uniref:hypothetical protein n=1 Tax=Burkholderia pseudomallei TaxID=28450 RepID=UPI0008FF3AF4|nr:hypothetical protein [Burkholderia pseudomallei]APD35046.1 hypothetical protein BK015_07720 [Burkholderia pseudomallei]ARK41488.1 hypothetical protein BOC60_15545 [Burkholderia pseudomallei]ARL60497.1 hypothetical protein BOC52_29695 [Burkholderia pseudomallei]ARL66922.1 hypothetical protein BOC53_26775 [Burkholderia pseudomallei]